ncbi:hypothetical protein HanIR_Chr08g0389801 [Helianthus annuus]|nr:hypothetical protein HanIR_Chr08g0389801 [Helianthus annuus]
MTHGTTWTPLYYNGFTVQSLVTYCTLYSNQIQQPMRHGWPWKIFFRTTKVLVLFTCVKNFLIPVLDHV